MISIYTYVKFNYVSGLKPIYAICRTICGICCGYTDRERTFSKEIIICDKAQFYLSGYVNKQNCQILRIKNP